MNDPILQKQRENLSWQSRLNRLLDEEDDTEIRAVRQVLQTPAKKSAAWTKHDPWDSLKASVNEIKSTQYDLPKRVKGSWRDLDSDISDPLSDSEVFKQQELIDSLRQQLEAADMDRREVVEEFQSKERNLLKEMRAKDQKREKREEEVSNRENAVALKEAELKKKQDDFARRVAEHEDEIARRAAERDEVSRKTANFSQKEAELSARERSLAKEKAELERRESRIIQRETELKNWENRIMQKESRIEEAWKESTPVKKGKQAAQEAASDLARNLGNSFLDGDDKQVQNRLLQTENKLAAAQRKVALLEKQLSEKSPDVMEKLWAKVLDYRRQNIKLAAKNESLKEMYQYLCQQINRNEVEEHTEPLRVLDDSTDDLIGRPPDGTTEVLIRGNYHMLHQDEHDNS